MNTLFRILEKFTAANWTQIIIMIVLAIGAYYKFDFRVTNLENIAVSLANKIEKIDNEGTKNWQQKSQVDTAQDTLIAAIKLQQTGTVEKVGGLAVQVSTLEPKVERIDTNVQWIMDWIRHDRELNNSNKK